MQAATAPVERQGDAPTQARARTHEKDDAEAEADWGTHTLNSDGAGEDEPAPDAARRLAPAAPKTHKGLEHAMPWQRPSTRRPRTREPAATVPTEEPAPATPQQEEEEPAKTTPDVPPTTSTQPAPEPEATPTVATQPVAHAPPEEEVPAG